MSRCQKYLAGPAGSIRPASSALGDHGAAGKPARLPTSSLPASRSGREGAETTPSPAVRTAFGTEWYFSVWYCKVKVSVVYSKNSQGKASPRPPPLPSAWCHDRESSAGHETSHQTALLPNRLCHMLTADLRGCAGPRRKPLVCSDAFPKTCGP